MDAKRWEEKDADHNEIQRQVEPPQDYPGDSQPSMGLTRWAPLRAAQRQRTCDHRNLGRDDADAGDNAAEPSGGLTSARVLLPAA
jgi:hypothetical protein